MNIPRLILIGLVVAAVALALSASAKARKEYRSAARFEPPAENLATPAVTRTANEDLARGAWADAATRIDLLLNDHADDLFALDDEGLISVRGWAAAIPPEQLASLRNLGSRPLESAARLSIELLRKDPASKPEAFYAVAMRYPFTLAAADALLDAGDRSVRLGDAPGTAVFYAMAEGRGATLSDARAVDRAVALALIGQPLAQPPAAAQARLAEIQPRGFAGPVAFDASWWENPNSVHRARYFPYAAEGIYYIAGFKHLLAIKENGNLIWKWQPIDAPSRNEPDRPSTRSRGTPYVPAILASAAGPQMIFARQPRTGGREFCIRAFRAADGRLVWSSEGNPATDNLSIVSCPAVAGRFLYCVAVEFTAGGATLVLAAFESVTGKPVFRCPLGQMPDPRRLRDENRGWDDFWEQTEPTVAGDCVFVTPNVGTAFCVGRFDGKLRWTRVYDEEADAATRRFEQDHGGLPIPAELNQRYRYRCTPYVYGNVVVIAPQDAGSTFGLDARTGQKLWNKPSSPAHTLIGGAGGIAVLAGSSLTGLDVASGERKWFTEFVKATFVSGPPAIAAGAIEVPMSDGHIAVLALDSGKPAEPKFKHPSFRLVWSGEISKKILEEGLMLRAFGPMAK